MPPAEVRAWREGLGLSIAEAAEMLDVTARAWRRWEDGTRKAPSFLWRALRDVERELAAKRLR